MSTPARLIERATQLHRRGRLAEAEELYLRALDEAPDAAGGLHRLGMLHAETGRTDSATRLLAAAVQFEGPGADLCTHLGMVLEQQNELEAAAACYRQALAADPAREEVWTRLGSVLGLLGRYGEAAHAWSRAVELLPHNSPRLAECYCAWGNAQALGGDRVSACESYRRAVAYDPAHVESNFHLAVALMQAGRGEQAETYLEATLRLDPRHARAHNNLAILRRAREDQDGAEQHCREALSIDPGYREARYNLGTLLQENGRLGDAERELARVLSEDPRHTSAWTNLGNCHLADHQIGAAVACYDRALSLDPDDPNAGWNRGLALLTRGDLQAGWPGYELRFAVPGHSYSRLLPAPLWQGEPLAGKTIFVYPEQGLGDTIQFCRYLPLLEASGAHVLFECPPRLRTLLQSLHWRGELIEPGTRTGRARAYDYQVPLLSLPARFRTDLASIPAGDAYLAPPETRLEHWSGRLAAHPGRLRAGLVWQGNCRHKADRHRSVPMELFRPLAESESVSFYGFQFGVEAPPDIAAVDLGPELGDFGDTAAALAQMDLLLTVDTSTAHLAAATGRETWILLAHSADWRWMQSRTDSPWYPSVRLFRQTEAGNWTGVLEQVTAALFERAAACRSGTIHGKGSRVQGPADCPTRKPPSSRMTFAASGSISGVTSKQR